MNNQRVSTNSVIVNDKYEILILKRSDADEVFPSQWELSGGGVQYGELPEVSLIREVKEEAGLDVNIIMPLTVSTYYINNIQYFEITFLSELKDNNQKVILSNEHSEYKWLNFKDISSFGFTSYIKNILEKSEKNLKKNYGI